MTLVLGKNEEYRADIELAQEITGIDGAAIAALIDAEAARIKRGANVGKWDRRSYNRKSRAAGLTQFLETTWLGHARNPTHLLNARAKSRGFVDGSNRIVAGKKNALLELRFDPQLSIVSAAEYGQDNLKVLRNAGVLPDEITDDQRARYMYLAHHEGAGGAIGFLTGRKTYTRADLLRQIEKAKADRYIARCGGSSSAAYRKWLNDFMDEKIVPAKFREAAVEVAVAPAGLRPVATVPDEAA